MAKSDFLLQIPRAADAYCFSIRNRLPGLLLYARPFAFDVAWVVRGTDQLNAMKYFRRQLNEVLGKIGFELGLQSYDNVLKENERQEAAFEATCEYIARNPERKKLVNVDRYMDYKFTDCLVPGAPEIKFFDKGFWDSFWRVCSASREKGLMRLNR